MKIMIDIPKHIYEHAKEESEDSNDEWDAMRAIANGTPLKDWLSTFNTESATECYTAVQRLKERVNEQE